MSDASPDRYIRQDDHPVSFEFRDRQTARRVVLSSKKRTTAGHYVAAFAHVQQRAWQRYKIIVDPALYQKWHDRISSQKGATAVGTRGDGSVVWRTQIAKKQVYILVEDGLIRTVLPLTDSMVVADIRRRDSGWLAADRKRRVAKNVALATATRKETFGQVARWLDDGGALAPWD